MKQFTKAEAIRFGDSGAWKELDTWHRAHIGLWQDRLCMPFEAFHEAIEKALGRPVYTHEFGLDRDGLKAELLGEKKSPTIDDILSLIPKDKRVILVLKEGETDNV